MKVVVILFIIALWFLKMASEDFLINLFSEKFFFVIGALILVLIAGYRLKHKGYFKRWFK